MAKEQSSKTGKVKPDPKKEKPETSGHGLAYFVPYLLFTVVIVAYSGFLYDTDGFRSHANTYSVLKPFEVLFDVVEKYSPFHQVLSNKQLKTSIGLFFTIICLLRLNQF
jgi:hypothetical protein